MTIDRKQLGKAIRSLRTRRGMTQVELSRAARMSGTGNTVALIERGERGVSMKAINRLAKALEVPAGCLAALGSRAESGHPELAGLLKSIQELIVTTVEAQEEFRRTEGRRDVRRRRRETVRQ